MKQQRKSRIRHLENLIDQAQRDVNLNRRIHALTELKRESVRGFELNRLRRQIWSLLIQERSNLGIKLTAAFVYPSNGINSNSANVEKFRDIVRKDVARSFVGFDITENMDNDTKKIYRQALETMLLTLLSVDCTIQYIQGLHDICSVFLIVCGEHLGTNLLVGLCNCFIKYCFHSFVIYVYTFLILENE